MTNSKPKCKSVETIVSKADAKRPLPLRPGRSATKHARLLGMLRSKRGVSISAMTKATGWQQHSVRGFLAGVVKKKLRLDLRSEKTKSGRIYRVVAGGSKPTSRPQKMTEPTNA
jgi:hypothetical protein